MWRLPLEGQEESSARLAAIRRCVDRVDALNAAGDTTGAVGVLIRLQGEASALLRLYQSHMPPGTIAHRAEVPGT